MPELDLENVKVKYTLKEIILLCSMIMTGVTHMVRTEMEFTSVKKELSECQRKVEKFEKNTNAGINQLLNCKGANAGPPCVPSQEESK